MKQGPNPIDRHVGAMLFRRRRFLGLSQWEIGDALGVTTLEIQKYESGVQRVAADSLQKLCFVLNVHASFFFDGMLKYRKVQAAAQPKWRGKNDRGGFDIFQNRLDLNRAFGRIDDPGLRSSFGKPKNATVH
jgi:transcriptional regulator with XRE-family HTH domain